MDWTKTIRALTMSIIVGTTIEVSTRKISISQTFPMLTSLPVTMGKTIIMGWVLQEEKSIKPTILLKDIKGQQVIALTILRMDSKVTKSRIDLRIVRFPSIKEIDQRLIGSLITIWMYQMSEVTLMKKTKGQYRARAQLTFRLKKSVSNSKPMPQNGSKMSSLKKLAASTLIKAKTQCYVAYLLTKGNTL